MKLNWIILSLTVAFLFFVGFLILQDQFTQIGFWFQFSDLHHETFALILFALAVGIIIGAIIMCIR
ncbi:MAG TPA: hypothetical protein VK209_12705 [Candidatus Sulfotelmatobacter sp.]|nr:hypothetical protein [Candidatus Sulfotelmatobacter sp.]